MGRARSKVGRICGKGTFLVWSDYGRTRSNRQ